MDIKSAVCMNKNGNDKNHTKQISRRKYFVRDGKKRKMHRIEWYEGGLQLADIATKNVGETHNEVYHGKYWQLINNTCTRELKRYMIVCVTRVIYG